MINCAKHNVWGFTLLEVVIAQLVLLALAIAVVPVYSTQLSLERAMWSRRQALKFIDAQLEDACSTARISFNSLTTTTTGTTTPTSATTPLGPTAFPNDLTAAYGTRVVTCLLDGTTNPDGSMKTATCPSDLLQVAVTAHWTLYGPLQGSVGRLMSVQSEPYLIARTGVCGGA